MKRHYLEEDLGLIQHYFPGATTVNLRTPFDLTVRAVKPRVAADQFRSEDDGPRGRWYGDLLWNR